MKFKLDLRKSAAENAELYYQKSKKAKQKLVGAKKALEETLRKIEKLDGEREISTPVLKKKMVREKRWYEKFRWFFSSDNFLVIGGKDATTNEILIKRHTEPNDLIFHANIQGAPFFVIKNSEKREIPEGTKRDAAQAAASYSKAWTIGSGSCDVYCIKPGQVSKKAPSGEYLGKGAFIIHGRREWFRGMELELAIGIRINEDTRIIGGPVDSVISNSDYSVVIGVGDKKSGELAKEIKKEILKKAKKRDIEKIEEINIQEIQHWIPGGKGRLLK